MRIWKRFSFVSFLLALLITGAGFLAWKLYPAKFKAQARLYLAAQQPKILFQTVETQESGVDAYKRFQSTQQTLVKGEFVLNEAIGDPKVSQYPMITEQVDPVAWLQENLNVEFVSGSEVMEISLSGDNPEQVAGIVNAITKAYLEEVESIKEDLAPMEDSTREIHAQVEVLSVELQAPPRIRIIDLAVPQQVRLRGPRW